MPSSNGSTSEEFSRHNISKLGSARYKVDFEWMCSVPHPGHTASNNWVLSLIQIISFTVCFDVNISRHFVILSWKRRVFCSHNDLSLIINARHSFKLSQSVRIFSRWSNIFLPCWGVMSSSFIKIPAIVFPFLSALFWAIVHNPIFVKFVGFTNLRMS